MLDTKLGSSQWRVDMSQQNNNNREMDVVPARRFVTGEAGLPGAAR